MPNRYGWSLVRAGGPWYLRIAAGNLTGRLKVQGQSTGVLLDLDSDGRLGVCDTGSATIPQPIEGPITVTVILGGAPIVYGVTREPSLIISDPAPGGCEGGCTQGEFEFTK